VNQPLKDQIETAYYRDYPGLIRAGSAAPYLDGATTTSVLAASAAGALPDLSANTVTVTTNDPPQASSPASTGHDDPSAAGRDTGYKATSVVDGPAATALTTTSTGDLLGTTSTGDLSGVMSTGDLSATTSTGVPSATTSTSTDVTNTDNNPAPVAAGPKHRKPQGPLAAVRDAISNFTRGFKKNALSGNTAKGDTIQEAVSGATTSQGGNTDTNGGETNKDSGGGADK
jgi:hypothetical protein